MKNETRLSCKQINALIPCNPCITLHKMANPISNLVQSIRKWKTFRMKHPAAAFLLIFPSCALWAQGVRENIILNGKCISGVSINQGGDALFGMGND
jgi:hypothetical protein